MRQAGVLLPVASLPSPFGIGDFGPEAYTFVNYLKKVNAKIWQLLPLNPLGYGNSPYQPYSSIAMDELYISLELLYEQNYIRKPKRFRATAQQVDYQAVRTFKQPYYKEAFLSFKKLKHDTNKKYKQFAGQQWVYEYAVFLTLKKQNDLRSWNEWPLDQQQWITNRQYNLESLKDNIQYEIFIQYTLSEQWTNLKRYANKKGVKLMGDIPFYVGMDSHDVWSNQNCFLLDDKSRPIFIAGVPPDYFSATGQRWGNPIYNWKHLTNTRYSFWVERLRYNQQMFDIIRIDHFRAFDTYWKIPAACPTAIEGEWIEAPGYDLFDVVLTELPNIEIVAEDLGDLRPQVLLLRDHFKFPGMKIIQFTFDPNENNNNFEDRENMLIYTGTHDNQTIKGWLAAQSKETRQHVKKYFKKSGIDQGTTVRNFSWFTLQSIANTAILPMQDILELDDRSRLNTPGTVGSPNWEWKLASWKKLEEQLPFLRKAIRASNRHKMVSHEHKF